MKAGLSPWRGFGLAPGVQSVVERRPKVQLEAARIGMTEGHLRWSSIAHLGPKRVNTRFCSACSSWWPNLLTQIPLRPRTQRRPVR